MKLSSLLKHLPRRVKSSREARDRRRTYCPLLMESLEQRILLALADDPALLLLEPMRNEALDVSGNGSVQFVGSTAVVNSKSPSAVDVDGHGYLAGDELDIVGSPGRSVSEQGKIAATIHVGIVPQADPLASLPAPAQSSSTFKAGNYSGDLYPGT